MHIRRGRCRQHRFGNGLYRRGVLADCLCGEPCIDQRGNAVGTAAGLFHDEMAHARDAMQIGMWQPRREIVSEVVVEHRVGGSPGKKHRHGQGLDVVCHRGNGRRRRMLFVEGHVADELGNCSPLRGPTVRPAQAATSLRIKPPTRKQQGAVDERARAMPDQGPEWSGCREPNQPRSSSSGRYRNTGVAQHDRTDPCSVAQHPTQRNRPTPIMRCRDHRPGDVECVDEVGKVVDPLCEAPPLGSLGQAHAQLVDGDDAVAIGKLGEEAAPRERPGRVAVHAQDRACGRLRRMTGVEHVPAVALTTRCHIDKPRPRGIDPECPPLVGRWRRRLRVRPGSTHRRHQSSSVKLMFRPEPTPMHSTRSPTLMDGAAPASVIGIAAGPTLPNRG
jgi:hypothetical protein